MATMAGRNIDSDVTKKRRKEDRLREENKVVVEWYSDGGSAASGKTFLALTEDVSPGGVRVVTSVLLPADAQVKLELVLSRSRKIVRPIAKVRWMKRLYGGELFEVGLEFLELSPEDRLALLEHSYTGKT